MNIQISKDSTVQKALEPFHSFLIYPLPGYRLLIHEEELSKELIDNPSRIERLSEQWHKHVGISFCSLESCDLWKRRRDAHEEAIEKLCEKRRSELGLGPSDTVTLQPSDLETIQLFDELAPLDEYAMVAFYESETPPSHLRNEIDGFTFHLVLQRFPVMKKQEQPQIVRRSLFGMIQRLFAQETCTQKM